MHHFASRSSAPLEVVNRANGCVQAAQAAAVNKSPPYIIERGTAAPASTRTSWSTHTLDSQTCSPSPRALLQLAEPDRQQHAYPTRRVYAAKRFAAWLRRPHAALGGRRLVARLDTPQGIDGVGLLGSIESGAYHSSVVASVSWVGGRWTSSVHLGGALRQITSARMP
jgi:hypothetical protein